MKFSIEKDELQKEILIAQKVITEKNVLAIAASVFLEARKGGSLLIRATDLNASFETAIPADVAEAGSALVFCEKLRGALLSLPAGEIGFSSDGASATVVPRERKASFKFKTLSAGGSLEACAARFPEIPSSEGGRVPCPPLARAKANGSAHGLCRKQRQDALLPEWHLCREGRRLPKVCRY